MYNRIGIAGRLVNDPELRKTSNDVSVVSFRIACDRDYKTQDADCDFFDVVAWRGTAEFVCNYFEKGQPILVSGRLQSREWEDDEGGKHRNVEILANQVYFAGSKPQPREEEDEDPKPAKNYKKPAPAKANNRRR